MNMTDTLEHAMQQHVQEASMLMKQLSSPPRLMILCALVNNELSVHALNKKIPLSQSALSQHLARLRSAGLVKTRKEKQSVFYRLQGNEVIQIMTTLKKIYCPELTLTDEFPAEEK